MVVGLVLVLMALVVYVYNRCTRPQAVDFVVFTNEGMTAKDQNNASASDNHIESLQNAEKDKENDLDEGKSTAETKKRRKRKKDRLSNNHSKEEENDNK